MSEFDVRYAKSGDGHVAYMSMGDGPVDLVWLTGGLVGFASFFEEAGHARFITRLAEATRLVVVDTRGVGMSDPIDPKAPPSIPDHARDVLAVFDAAGIERGALFASVASVPIALLFAARHPDRLSHLMLFHGTARLLAAGDYPIGLDHRVREFFDAVQEPDAETRIDGARFVAPSRADDRAFLSWFDRAGRAGASPATARALRNVMLDTDVREVLPVITTPTLVLHRRDNTFTPIAFAQYIVERIAGARLVELPGADQMIGAGDVDAVADEIIEFVTGTRPVFEPERVLATIMFTDLVDSTARSAAMGDVRWRARLQQHDASIRLILDRNGGRELKTMGDGFLALFTSPARAIRAATAIRDALAAIDMPVRLGLHTGEVEVVGVDVGGIAVAIAARVMGLAGPGEVLVSGAIPPLVAGSLLEFEDRGEHELKGVPGRWRVHRVVGR